MQPYRIVLVTSDHPGWETVRTTLNARQDLRLIEVIQQPKEIMPAVQAVAKVQPLDAILVAAERPDLPLNLFVQNLRNVSRTSKTIIIGTTETLDGDTLISLMHLVSCYLTWEGLRPAALVRCIATVLGGDAVVASPSVLAALHQALERRHGARVEGLVLTPQEQVGRIEASSCCTCPSGKRGTLWADNPDLTFSLPILFSRRGVPLDVVYSSDALLQAATPPRPDHFLIIDCATAADASMRCNAIITHTAVDVHICHPSKDFVDDLQRRAMGQLYWLPSSYTGLDLFNKLDAYAMASATATAATAPSPLTTLVARLSPRDRDVLRLVAEGYLDKQIAAKLNMTEGTVKWHVANIKAKVGMERRQELPALYFRAALN